MVCSPPTRLLSRSISIPSTIHLSPLPINPNGSFVYTPQSNYFGSDSFTYRAFDGTLYSSTTVVNITISSVNDIPIAVSDNYSTNEDTTLLASSVLANDSDVETSSLIAQLVTTTSHGTLTLNANGSFTYVPLTNYFGSDSFTYQAFDGTAKSPIAIVNITVNAVNDSPEANDDNFTISEDSTLNATVRSNDIDVDSPSLIITLLSPVSHGSLT
jgi:VCBS repeat-containing protein